MVFGNQINLTLPRKLVFGNHCSNNLISEISERKLKRIYILSVDKLVDEHKPLLLSLKENSISFRINTGIKTEPSFADFREILKDAQMFGADGIIGWGGGSIMDTAKLVAAVLHEKLTNIDFVQNTDKLTRQTFLACIPTTSGTGSEVSPNAIFFNDDGSKTGIIHPSLVPESAYVDPVFTCGLPPYQTAFTGMDALTHCIEAFVNKNSHPIVDNYAIEGIRLIGNNINTAFFEGENLHARAAVSLGSMYGGLCLGPVNTAAVHALAYPLGNFYKIPHGVANALLLPFVLEYNLESAPQKYALVAEALGVEHGSNDIKTADKGIAKIKKWLADFGLPQKLSDLNIPENDLGKIAESAIKVQRLLKNNVREVNFNDALEIYLKAF